MKLKQMAAAAALLISVSATMRGQEPVEPEIVRPVNSSWTLEGGSSHLGDTYLSPLKYTGWHTAFQYERLQAMKFSPERWRQQLQVGVQYNNAKNVAKNATMHYASLAATWGMLHVWKLSYNISLAAGGSAGGSGGVIYNTRNGNNPASAKVDITVNATGWATWSTRIGRMPVMLRWQTTMPVIGAFFSPDYDELYYELYLGNRHGLVHCAWPGNFFKWDNLVTADLDFSTTRLRMGFRSRIFSSEVNHITTRTFSYAFVLGVTGDWFSVSARRGVPSETARFIYAY